MALEVEQADELDGGGGNFIDKPGVYHMVVTEIDENPATSRGEPMDGLEIGMSCLASTVEGQKDRSAKIILKHPSPDDTSDQRKKRITAFCLATCLIGQHQPGKKVTVEPSDSIGRQFVCKLQFKRTKDEITGNWVDMKFMDFAYSDIWHVDDNHVLKTGIMLDQGALDMIPAELRKTTQNEAAPASNGKVTRAVNPVGSTRNSKAVDLADV